MRRAEDLFTEEHRQAVTAAVVTAESRTAAEILPVVATASGRYARAESLWGLLLALAFLVGGWWSLQGVVQVPRTWGVEPELRLGLSGVLLLLLLGYLLGQLLASLAPCVRQLLVTRREMSDEVERSAHAAFHRFGVRRTAGRTGVLIYLSLCEGMVRIIPDEAIARATPPAPWQELADSLAQGMARGEPTPALVQTIHRCGELLEQVLPRQPDDRDELSNELHLID